MLGKLSSLLVGLLMCSNAFGQEPIVFIVHPASSVQTLGRDQLEAIYSGKLLRWPDGQKVVAIDQSVDSTSRAVVYELLFQAPAGKTFAIPGSPAPFRTTVRKSDISARRLVSRLPNAIGYIRLNAVDERVRVLAVDGKSPDDPDYAFNLTEGSLLK